MTEATERTMPQWEKDLVRACDYVFYSVSLGESDATIVIDQASQNGVETVDAKAAIWNLADTSAIDLSWGGKLSLTKASKSE